MEKKMENEMETGFIWEIIGIRVSQKQGYLFGDPHNKDHSILGSILGSPYLGKVPYHENMWGTILQANSHLLPHLGEKQF